MQPPVAQRAAAAPARPTSGISLWRTFPLTICGNYRRNHGEKNDARDHQERDRNRNVHLKPQWNWPIMRIEQHLDADKNENHRQSGLEIAKVTDGSGQDEIKAAQT